MNSDKDLLNIYLLLLKSNTEVYVHGTLESSNEKVRKVIKDSLDKTMNSQYSCFNLMVENKFYTVENTKCKKINETYSKLTSKNEQN